MKREEIDSVTAALNDPNQVCNRSHCSLSSYIGLGEEFGMPIGTNVEGKMVPALKEIGFDRVFDVNATQILQSLRKELSYLVE